VLTTPGIAVELLVQYGRSHLFDVEADVRLMSYGPLNDRHDEIEPDRALGRAGRGNR
jgi:hypothetical protein